MFVIPDGVGGRFSELSPVGLLPAAGMRHRYPRAAGRRRRDGCTLQIRRRLAKPGRCWKPRCNTSPRKTATANVQVVMPYADSLKYMADWFCQLWAESLGKNKTRKNMAINCGQTPTKALGVTDQHSQLQLYTEGAL